MGLTPRAYAHALAAVLILDHDGVGGPLGALEPSLSAQDGRLAATL